MTVSRLVKTRGDYDLSRRDYVLLTGSYGLPGQFIDCPRALQGSIRHLEASHRVAKASSEFLVPYISGLGRSITCIGHILPAMGPQGQ